MEVLCSARLLAVRVLKNERIQFNRAYFSFSLWRSMNQLEEVQFFCTLGLQNRLHRGRYAT